MCSKKVTFDSRQAAKAGREGSGDMRGNVQWRMD